MAEKFEKGRWDSPKEERPKENPRPSYSVPTKPLSGPDASWSDQDLMAYIQANKIPIPGGLLVWDKQTLFDIIKKYKGS